MNRFVLGAIAVMAMTASAALAKMAIVSEEECVKRAELIVIGKVTEIATQESMPENHELTIAVTKVLKGKADKSINLRIPGIARNTIPKSNDEKIFLLTPAEGGKGYVMAVGATMFSVRDLNQEAAIQKIIDAQAAQKK